VCLGPTERDPERVEVDLLIAGLWPQDHDAADRFVRGWRKLSVACIQLPPRCRFVSP
jgi:hypothetical protein